MAPLPPTFSLEPRFKEQFAQFLDAGFSPFIAAMKIWPHDAGLASMVAEQWPNDPYVIATRELAKEKQAAEKKPTGKVDQIKRIESKFHLMDAAEYLKAERLIAEMSGHIEKAAPAAVNVNTGPVIERVLVVKDHGDDEAWERKLASQQGQLIEGNV
jgi:hypothetical protein